MNQSVDSQRYDLTRTHYAQLDGLRGLAILLVVVYHYGLSHVNSHDRSPPWFLQFAQLGWAGVDLFFVLSGFLITSILLETKNRAHYFRNFLARRFLRIWPLYYLTLTLFFVVLPLVLSNALPDALRTMQAKQAWFWLYGANWLFAKEGGFEQTSGGYFWSLAVEEQFYLVWPFIVFKLSERRLLFLCAGLFLLSFVGRIALLAKGFTTSSVYVITFTHLDGLAVGAAISILLRNRLLNANTLRLLPWIGAVAFACVLSTRFFDGSLFFWGNRMALYGYALLALAFGCALVSVLSSSESSIVHRVFAKSFMAPTGKYSYALYMVHVPIGDAYYRLMFSEKLGIVASIGYGATFALFFCCAIATSWLVAFLSWHVFEKHILKLKKYFEYERAEAIHRRRAIESVSVRERV